MLNRWFDSDASGRADGFVPVARLIDLTDGRLKRVTVSGQSVVLALVDKCDANAGHNVVAFSTMCPHALGDLSQGWLTNAELDCPVHYYRFDLRTGQCAFPIGGPALRMYPVAVEADVILLKVEQPKWMDQSGQ